MSSYERAHEAILSSQQLNSHGNTAISKAMNGRGGRSRHDRSQERKKGRERERENGRRVERVQRSLLTHKELVENSSNSVSR